MLLPAALKRQQFRKLHQQSEVLVLPNPWDIGSLRYLEHLGACALATTSAGFAWTLAKEDYEITLQESLTHIEELVTATNLPVNADFETGFAENEEELYLNVRLLEQTGVAAFSIEDRFGEGLYDLEVAVGRVKAAKNAAIEYGGKDFMLVARCEGLLTGSIEIKDVIKRLQSYVQAGADVVYAPGLRSLEDIAKVVKAVDPIPLNVLIWQDGLTIEQLAQVGVKRVSTGSRLAASARSAFENSARSVIEHGYLPHS